MLCYVTLRYVTLRYVTLRYVMLCYVMLCYVTLCYVMLCYVMLCYVMLCYVMLWYVNLFHDRRSLACLTSLFQLQRLSVCKFDRIANNSVFATDEVIYNLDLTAGVKTASEGQQGRTRILQAEV